MKLLKYTVIVSAMSVATMSVTAMSAQAGSLGKLLGKADIEIPDNNCFWTGPYVKENPVTNIAFPDTGAKYWATNFSIPEGASLDIYGRYMHNRYMSFNSYDITGENPTYAPGDAITDIDLNPIFRFAKNPYIEGNRRNKLFRGYKIKVLPGAPEASDPDNTLHSMGQYGERATILLRSYVEDEDTGTTAGEYLPSPVVTLNDGTVITDIAEICQTLEVDSSIINPPLVPVDKYDQMAAFGHPYSLDATEENPNTLTKAFNPSDDINCGWFGFCHPAPTQATGYYANLDNQYVTAVTTNAKPIEYPETALGLPAGTTPRGKVVVGFQKSPELAVAVFKGKLPVTPKTLEGSKRAKAGEVRYWSFCTNEYMSQKVTDCLFDEQITVDEEGYYTIAVSWEEDRPENATAECGYNWLPASMQGDGYLDILEQEVERGELDPSVLSLPNQLGKPRENNPHQNIVIVRNMLPAADFEQAIQNVSSYTDTEAVMGEYAVQYHYESTIDFESRGCN